jgi:large subunit ribosomal protein L24
MRKFTDTQQKSYASRKKRVQRVLRQAVAKMKLKKGDTVIVVSGKDKGKKGEITRVLPNVNRVVVDGVAQVKRHLKSTGRGQSGRIVEKPASIHASNVMIVDSSGKPSRISRKRENGKMVRIATKTKTAIK